MMSVNLLGDGRIGGGVNRELTPEVSSELGSALGTMLGERVLVVAAREYYPPSRMLKRAFSAGLMSTGVTVVDFHAATFPELAFAVKKFGAKAGVHFAVSPF
ncbi:MAG: phosphoglucomutase, partial [Thermoprotei archaeon]